MIITSCFLPISDPDVDKWLFMQSPVPVVTILSLYLYFVLKLGPQWMSTRKPFQMKPLLIAYNGYQVLFSIWLCSHVSYDNNSNSNSNKYMRIVLRLIVMLICICDVIRKPWSDINLPVSFISIAIWIIVFTIIYRGFYDVI